MVSRLKRDKKSVLSQKNNETIRDIKRCWQLYLIIALPLIWLIIFKYWPMYGVQIAFREYRAVDGIMGSEWVGLFYFEKFFSSYQFEQVLVNTLTISIYQLLASFPFPIILALALNSTNHIKFKKFIQMITYMPHFISVVVLVGMILQFTNVRVGIINMFVTLLGGTATDYMADPNLFSSIYVWSGVWQTCGWGTIIYLAALAGVDPALHEAAMIDGATRFQRILYVDLPCIIPTAIILLIMNCGRIMEVGFEKVFLMQNSLNTDTSEIISTFVYKIGLASSAPNFSYAAAIGLFNSIVNLILIVIVNSIAKKTSETSIW